MFILLSSPAFAQRQVVYSHDAAGNRVKQEKLSQETFSTPALAIVQEGISSRTTEDCPVRITPNKDNNILSVSVISYSSKDNCVADVFSSHGYLVFSREISSVHSDLFLNQLPPDVYILKITLNETRYTWKIIKQ